MGSGKTKKYDRWRGETDKDIQSNSEHIQENKEKIGEIKNDITNIQKRLYMIKGGFLVLSIMILGLITIAGATDIFNFF